MNPDLINELEAIFKDGAEHWNKTVELLRSTTDEHEFNLYQSELVATSFDIDHKAAAACFRHYGKLFVDAPSSFEGREQ